MAVLNAEQVKKILPHRHPMLLIDEVVEMSEDSVIAAKNLTNADPFFAGHFPGRPIMPGVLMIEALAQAGGILILTKSGNNGRLAYLASVTEAKFRRVVVPGERLLLKVQLLKMKSRIGLVHGVAEVNGEIACEAEILMSLAES